MNISINHPGNSIITGALIPVGSRDESPKYKGISHFLEHMLFKGTMNRNVRQILTDVEQYGAVFNAYTSEECTFYYVEISKDFVQKARDVIFDMVTDSILPPDEFDKEREVVLQELQMYTDNPQTAIFEIANKYIFAPTSGLHIPVIGTKESIENITRNKMMDYYLEKYRNPITLEVGDIQEQINKIELPKKFNVEVQNSDTSDVYFTRPGITQANMVLTGLLDLNPNVISNDYSLRLFTACMNDFSGRLFQVIREQYHMVYSVYFTYNVFSCGTVQYYVYAALEPQRVNEAKELILTELTRPLTDKEIEFATLKWIGQRALNDDKINNIAAKTITCLIRGVPFIEYFDKAEANIQIAKKNILDFQNKNDFRKNSKLIAIVPER